ncbi:hypothetical protein DSAG12_02697 [Promethearchaeum syntrophicum]|uniref:Uncharacterized protein n=1 Tax=Promethearchaeum syntrophicum TaxID=2594042 RepID=A0A5B9DDB5_9ARCH|nr:hypothetical protein [Candidatus Prometheoarchaeum syntrophicum]QEE16867.1 hypothetical protein DSAG12_02697 [Candidatus Prometheoarchaeum syntrophicum]
MQARLDFSDFMSIDDLIFSSYPTNILLSNGLNMKDGLDNFESEFVNFQETNNCSEKKTYGEKASPWHHNWIWWETSSEIDKKEFDIEGKYFKYALGMSTRSDKLEKIDEEINIVVLKIYKDLQVSRTPRLIFTSVFKTRLFKQMVKILHGWEF